MRAVVAVGRAPAGADPPIAAVVALALLGERLEEAAHELVGGESLVLGELLLGELGQVLRLPEPLEEPVGHLVAELPFDALEHAREDPVVRVEERLALHETGATEMVEAEEVRAVEPL